MQSLHEYSQKALQRLPEVILEQREKPTYLRPKLVPLDPEKVNGLMSLPPVPEGIFRSAKEISFHAWNAEGVEDYGWGCSYRTLQTSLSAYKVHVAIEELFHLFGQKKTLQELYSSKYPELRLEAPKPFAPYELEKGWAEPFIGEMAMHFYGIHSSLESLNAIPKWCNAPKDVFHREPLTFTAFKMRLITHFEQENPAPVMLDDSLFALNIVGIGLEGDLTKLWIADPHVKPGINHLKEPSQAIGFFTVTLDDKGNQVTCSLSGKDHWQVDKLFSKRCHEGLQFAEKHWMVLFPE